MKAIICRPAPEVPQAPKTVEEDFEGDKMNIVCNPYTKAMQKHNTRFYRHIAKK